MSCILILICLSVTVASSIHDPQHDNYQDRAQHGQNDESPTAHHGLKGRPNDSETPYSADSHHECPYKGNNSKAYASPLKNWPWVRKNRHRRSDQGRHYELITVHNASFAEIGSMSSSINYAALLIDINLNSIAQNAEKTFLIIESAFIECTKLGLAQSNNYINTTFYSLFSKSREVFNELKLICLISDCDIPIFNQKLFPLVKNNVTKMKLKLPWLHSQYNPLNSSNTPLISLINQFDHYHSLQSTFGTKTMHSNESEAVNRHTRQAGGFVLGALASIGLDIYTQVEIESLIKDIRTNRNALNKVNLQFRKTNLCIREIEKNIGSLQSHFLQLINTVNQTSLTMQLEQAEIYFSSIVQSMSDFAKGFLHIITRKEIPSSFLHLPSLVSLTQDLMVQAAAKGLQMASTNFVDIINAPLSYISKQNNLQIILHVPLLAKKQFKIFEFSSLLVQLDREQAVTITSSEKFLAIDEQSAESITLTNEEFRHCRALGKTFICHHPIVKRSLEESCLGLIWLGKFNSAVSKCDAKVHKARSKIMPIGDATCLVFITAGDTAELQCEQANSSVIISESGYSVIQVPPKCILISSTEIFRPSFDTGIRSTIVLRPIGVPRHLSSFHVNQITSKLNISTIYQVLPDLGKIADSNHNTTLAWVLIVQLIILVSSLTLLFYFKLPAEMWQRLKCQFCHCGRQRAVTPVAHSPVSPPPPILNSVADTEITYKPEMFIDQETEITAV